MKNRKKYDLYHVLNHKSYSWRWMFWKNGSF